MDSANVEASDNELFDVSLTYWLRKHQHKDALDTAIHHPFLRAAGVGTLPETELCAWLVQDKYYQFAYVNFIGRLIAKMNLTSYAFPRKDEINLEWWTFEILTDALNAIKAEIEFYDQTLKQYILKVDEVGPNEVTKAYVQLFRESSAEDKPLLHGLTVLWATEYVYHQAWSYANRVKAQVDVTFGNAAATAVRDKFIPNWTSTAFNTFVEQVGSVTDRWANIVEAEHDESCARLWKRVLDLETSFWPRPSDDVLELTDKLLMSRGR